MPREPLSTVLELRRREVDEARRVLAAALGVAATANERAKEAERAIEMEAQRASDPSGDDHLVEAFAAWLPIARERAIQARSLYDRHESEVARLRADLQACRTAFESVEALLAARAAERAAQATRKSQHELDEVASRIGQQSG